MLDMASSALDDATLPASRRQTILLPHEPHLHVPKLPPATFPATTYAKRYAMREQDMSAALRMEVAEWRRWWMQSTDTGRQGKALSATTMDKRVEVRWWSGGEGGREGVVVCGGGRGGVVVVVAACVAVACERTLG